MPNTTCSAARASLTKICALCVRAGALLHRIHEGAGNLLRSGVWERPVPNVDPTLSSLAILAGTDENDLMYGQAHVALR